MIKLSQSDFEAMSAYAKKHIPEEACGLIAGKRDGVCKVVEKVYYLENEDHASGHFSIDPVKQLAAVKDMRANGYEPLGNWHSHPETPARPSDEDKRLAFDGSASYMILSLMEPDAPVLKSFHIEGDAAEEEIINIM